MFVGITNTPRDYAWGSTTLLPELFGRIPTGAPEAELWLGAHPGSPSQLTTPIANHADSIDVGTDAGPASPRDLAAWVAAEPGAALGPALAASARLPFLLKLLAAGGPLSLQAHPTMEQAAAGFARENAAGVPSDAPHRNYKDAFHKPELIVALSDTFDALCGFRSLQRSRAVLEALRDLDASASGAASTPHDTVLGDAMRLAGVAGLAAPSGLDATVDLEKLAAAGEAASHSAPFDALIALLDGPDPLRNAVSWLLGGGAVVDELVARSVAVAHASSGHDQGELEPELVTLRELNEAYPGDPGVVLALLLNRVRLRAGESLWLPAGNIHAYLSGLGIELMAASDNVLRGGLTPKHVDVPELVSVLNFTPVPVPYLVPERPSAGVEVFRPELPDFMLYRIEAGAGAETGQQDAANIELDGPAIAIVTRGSVRLAGAGGSTELAVGEAVYVTPDERRLAVTGSGTVFVATTG